MRLMGDNKPNIQYLVCDKGYKERIKQEGNYAVIQRAPSF